MNNEVSEICKNLESILKNEFGETIIHNEC